MAQVTEHFSEAELGVEFAEARVKQNACWMAERILEPTRAHFNNPLRITNGFRSPGENAKVSDKQHSYHMAGCEPDATPDEAGRFAVDCAVLNVGLAQAFDWLRLESALPFDKVILEHDKNGVPVCVHVQADRLKRPRRQAFIGSEGKAHDYVEVAVGPAAAEAQSA